MSKTNQTDERSLITLQMGYFMVTKQQYRGQVNKKNSCSDSSYFLLFFIESNFFFKPLIHTASWQLEDLLADASMQSTRHLSVMPPVHFVFTSYHIQMKFEAVSNAMPAFFRSKHGTCR